MMICRWPLFILPALLCACAAGQGGPSASPGDTQHKPRNIILMVGDGMGFAAVRAYRGYADDPATPGLDPLVMDPLLAGAVSTQGHGDPSIVVDSAASATAYATGHDSYNGAIGVDPEARPLTTVLERARERGMAAGLVVTSQLTHATPAAFAAHVPSRRDSDAIADALIDNRINGRPLADVLLGGGQSHLQRADRDIAAEFIALGYQLVESADALEQAGPGPLLGLFAPGALPKAWDRELVTPSLAAMTAAALQRLEQDPDGFFLLVEGSLIDWAAHDNDVAGVVSEMQDFVAAVELALRFARRDGETLVLITADHDVGGLSLGIDDEYRWDPSPLHGMHATPRGVVERYLNEPDIPLSTLLAAAVDFELTAAETAALAATPREKEAALAAIKQLFDQRTGSGWTTQGHTAIDVPLYVYGPGSAQFSGLMENEVIGQLLMSLVSNRP